jgi:flagellin-like hook-associated protein FlgL
MVEDADMSETIIRLSAQQAALQASLATAARVVQPQLIDFLR